MPTQSPPFSGTTALVTQLGGDLQVPEDLYRGIPIMALPPRIGFHASHLPPTPTWAERVLELLSHTEVQPEFAAMTAALA